MRACGVRAAAAVAARTPQAGGGAAAATVGIEIPPLLLPPPLPACSWDAKFNNDQPMFFERFYEPLKNAADY
jgi:hypothetical protein